MAESSTPALQRRVGFLGAAATGVGIVLGAGIYVLIGESAGRAGNMAWAAFLIAALLAAGTGLSYAELTSMFPEAGAASAFASEAFGRRAAFLTGWADIITNAVAAPAVALGFGSYLAELLGIDRTTAAIALLLVCAVVILLGVAQTVALAAIFTLIEVGGLVAVIVVGIPHFGDVNLLDGHGGPAGLLGAAALVFFAYEGFEEIASLSEEVVEPEKNVPRALLLAVAITTALYVLVAAAAVSVVPWEQLAEAEGPLAAVAETVSPTLGQIVGVVALFATANTVLLILATGPRVMYGMSRRDLLPGLFGAIWAARGTPWFAILVALVVSLAFALTGKIGFVAQVTNFAVFVLFVAVNTAVIRLRMVRPDARRPFRSGPAIGTFPLPACAGIAGIVILGAFMDRTALAVGSAAMVIGLAASFAFLRGAEDEKA